MNGQVGSRKVLLRGYEDRDLAEMYALDRVCFERPFRFSRAAMRSFAEAKKARVVIAEVEAEEGAHRMAGFCIVHLERVRGERVGYVVTLDVTPEDRRSGVGQSLMQRAEAIAIKERCMAMALHVYTCNGAAIRFYERCGFVFSHRVLGFYGDGLDAEVWHKLFARV